MKLQVEEAKESLGKYFPFNYNIPGEELGDLTAFPWSRHDVNICGEYWFDGQRINLKGNINRTADYECSRCLASFNKADTIFFEESYEDSSNKDIFGDEDGNLFFEGDSIDITDLIRETLIINEPFQVLCQENCKGLCTKCGTNLNEKTCDCDTFVVDPRWADLKKLLKENENNDD